MHNRCTPPYLPVVLLFYRVPLFPANVLHSAQSTPTWHPSVKVLLRMRIQCRYWHLKMQFIYEVHLRECAHGSCFVLLESSLQINNAYNLHPYTLPLKRKGRQDDCPARHWGCWRQASTSPVTTRAVILTTFPFMWLTSGQSRDEPSVNATILENTDEWINHVDLVRTYIVYNNGHAKINCICYETCRMYLHLPY